MAVWGLVTAKPPHVSANPDPSAVVPIRPLPTGTVTFAFTDIEGSTERWDRNRGAMEAAVRRHDELVREAVLAHGGYVFKTLGDAFCTAFARPEDAVAAMLDAQRTLATADFSDVGGLGVRAAVHTGTADERDGDYFGPAVNRVARLLAIGHGGQVLLSGAAADLVQGDLPPQASLRDLGEHRLRDLSRPEQVYQLHAPSLPATFPPLRSLDALPNNLPRMRSTFVGREKELADITALIEKNSLVTLVGAGGVGKTRASLQVAANLLDGSGDGVWLIELAPLANGDYIPTTIAKALDVTLPTEGDPVANLVRALQPKQALLVFDNCEHVVDPAARVIAAILNGCPSVRILASSRQGLGLAGEATYRMPSLVLPNRAEVGHLTPVEAMRFSAIALFVERASAASSDFLLTDDNTGLIVDICRRLDGIPLAIELAAPRVKMLTLRQLNDRLDERFRILKGGSRDVLPRQQTLRALIDWSHELLDERERALFRRLGIFVDGFVLEGANAVGTGEELDEFDLFDVLASLVDKSLVIAELLGDGMRYRLLESTRAYAIEKLAASGEHESIAGRHLRYFRDRLVDTNARMQRTARQTELYEAFSTELEDIRAALEGAVSRNDILVGADLLGALGNWGHVGLAAEGIAWCDRYLMLLPGEETSVATRILFALSMMCFDSRQMARGLEADSKGIAAARASGDPHLLCDALRLFTMNLLSLGRLDEAASALSEAESIPNPTPWLRVRLLQNRATLSIRQGDQESAIRTFTRLRLEQRALGNARGEVVAAANQAEAEHARGASERAIETVLEYLPAIRTGRDRTLLASILANLAGYYVSCDAIAQCSMVVQEALSLDVALGPDHFSLSLAIEHLALARALRYNVAEGMKLEGFAENTFRRLSFQREYTERRTHERLIAIVREHLSPADAERHAAEGADLTPEAAVALATAVARELRDDRNAT